METRLLLFDPESLGLPAGPYGSFADDLDTALARAKREGNWAARDWILKLVVDYLHGDLASRDADGLEQYLKVRKPWHEFGAIDVFKTADNPCVFFAVVRYRDPDSREDGRDCVVHGLGLAYDLADRDWPALIEERCRLLGLLDPPA